MNCSYGKFIAGLLLVSTTFHHSHIHASDIPSTWTGTTSSNMNENSNWSDGIPYGAIAVFDGNGDNAPQSRQLGGISFEQIEVTSDTDISIITGITTNGELGVFIDATATAIFDIYEHQYPTFPAAAMRINAGPAGDGGGTVNYNLEGYGQLYAYSGAADNQTIVNVTMTGGNNYFEITNADTNLFHNVSSNSSTDEVFLATGANLTIKTSDTNTITGDITGDGSLTKAGAGTLTLEGDKAYTGDTLVSGGTLILNGAIPGNLTVNSGATFKGSSTIGGNFVSSGTVAPGNSIGILTVGNFLPTSSNIFECEISSSGASDQIIATQSAVLKGTLSILPLDSFYNAVETYTIVQATDSLSGTFSTIINPVPALAQLTYDSNSAYLTYLPISALTLRDNANGAAECFVTLTSADAAVITEELLSLSLPEIQQAFNQMQSSQFSALTWTQLENALLIRSSYSQHLNNLAFDDCCYNQNCSQVWVDGIGQWEHQNTKNDQFGYNDVTGGVSIGTDTCYDCFRFGAAASYTYSNIKWKEAAGNGRINSYYGGVYGRWNDDCIYLNGSLLGAYNHYDSSRHLLFGDIDRNTHASHNGWEVLAGLEAGFYSNLDCFQLIPFGRIDYIYLSQDGYKESGANSLNLQIANRQDQLFQSQIGFVLTNRFPCNESGVLVPRLELSYINQAPLGTPHYKTNFVNSSCQFDVSGWNFTRNLGAVSLALTYFNCCECAAITLQYDGQFGSCYWNQSGNISVSFSF